MIDRALFNSLVHACRGGHAARVLSNPAVIRRIKQPAIYPKPLPDSPQAVAQRRMDAMRATAMFASGTSVTSADMPSTLSTNTGDDSGLPPLITFDDAMTLLRAALHSSEPSTSSGSSYDLDASLEAVLREGDLISSTAEEFGATVGGTAGTARSSPLPDAAASTADYGCIYIIGGGYVSAAQLVEMAETAVAARHHRRPFWDSIVKGVELVVKRATATTTADDAPATPRANFTLTEAIALIKALAAAGRSDRATYHTLGRLLKEAAASASTDAAPALSFVDAVAVVKAFELVGMSDAAIAAIPATALAMDPAAARSEAGYADALKELFTLQRAKGAGLVDGAVLEGAAEIVWEDYHALRRLLKQDLIDEGADGAAGDAAKADDATGAAGAIQWTPEDALTVAEEALVQWRSECDHCAATMDADADAAEVSVKAAPMAYARMLAAAPGRAPLSLVVRALGVLGDSGHLTDSPQLLMDTVAAIVDAYADAEATAVETGAAEGVTSTTPGAVAAATAPELYPLLAPTVSDLCLLAKAAATARLDGACLWAVTALRTVAETEGKQFIDVVATAPLGALVGVWKGVCALEDGAAEAAEDGHVHVEDPEAAAHGHAHGCAAVPPMTEAVAEVLVRRAGALTLDNALTVVRALLGACVRSTLAAEAAATLKTPASDGSGFIGGTVCARGALLDAVAVRITELLPIATTRDMATALSYVASAATWRPPSVSIDAFEDYVEGALGKAAAIEAGMGLRRGQAATEAREKAAAVATVKAAARPAAALHKLQTTSRPPFAAFASDDVVALLSAIVKHVATAGATCEEELLLSLCRVAPKLAEDSRLPIPPTELVTRAEDLFGEAPAVALSRPYARFASADADREALHARREFERTMMESKGLEDGTLPISHPRGPGVGAETLMRAARGIVSDEQALKEMEFTANAIRESKSGVKRQIHEKFSRVV